MKDQYNPDEKSTYLQYLQTNNLYGWVMIQKLATHGLSWEKVEYFTPDKIDKLVKKYVAYAEYPNELHKKPQPAVIFSGENENRKDIKTSTIS